jgi:polysaccharide biosynthesis/export protein
MRSGWFFAVAFLAFGAPAYSQEDLPAPTSEQLEVLRNMSPEDRAALMETLGIGEDGQDTGSSGGQSRQNRSENRRDNNNNKKDGERSVDGQTSTEPRVSERRLQPNDTVLVTIEFFKDEPPRFESQGPNLPPVQIPGTPAPTFEPERKAEIERLMALIRSRNPYQLDSSGYIQLPGFAPIVLAGLDNEQATDRLRAIAAFRDLDVKATKLPVRKVGVASLKPFGYDLFRGSSSTFAPANDVPVPAEYIVGPGDQLNIQLFGTQNRNLRLVVGRDGRVNFPGLGPIEVGGRNFPRVAADIEQRVSRQMIGVNASVSMGDTRSIRVYVMGEASRPGSYTVSGLSTMTSALYAAGGVNNVGSLRDIQLKRAGAVVRRFDLYDLLLRGDTSDDAKLLPGDVIFVPPVADTVAVEGEVNRPAIYELKGETSVADMIALAGGVTSEADSSRVALVRVNDRRARVIVDVPIDTAAGRSETLRRGDRLRVLRLRPTLDSGVTVEGHVFRPASVSWREGLRLTDVLSSVDELMPDADLNYVMIRREMPPDRRIAVLSGDLSAALLAPGSKADITLMPRDRIIVFDSESGRQEQIAPVLEEMRRQARIDRPTQLVRIDGRVKARGDYPLEPNMRVSDLIRAGGGLQDAAFGTSAELARIRIVDGGRETTLVDVDLGAILRGDAAADLLLQPFDFLNVKEMPEWNEQEQVVLQGEVRFPGTYPIHRGETLRSVLQRAGGVTAYASPRGAVFVRDELRVREQEQLDRLAERLQGDLAATALQAVAANQSSAGQAMQVGQSLLNQLKTTKPVGRLVIDLENIMKSPIGSVNDVVLRKGDRLMIPKIRQEVTVIGEVQNSTSHFYRAELSRDDYIALSGGATRKADRGRIYVVRPDGSVVSSESGGWFRRSANISMIPGDTVVVPLDTERMPALPLWQAITGILYNLAISAAAVNSF